jgi:amino acid transporter
MGEGFRASRRQLLAFALISVLTKSTTKWQFSLRAGLGYEIIINFLSALACVVYYCCTSELTSAFPFPGGCFGFARCTVGFYGAFFIGCLEILYYLNSLSLSTSSISMMVSIGYPGVKDWRYLVIFVVYLLQYCMCWSKRVFYNAAIILAVYGVVMSVVYILGSSKQVDFRSWAYRVDTSSKYWNDDASTISFAAVDDDVHNSSFDYAAVDRTDAMFNPHSSLVMQSIARCLAVYMQIEYANLAVDDAKEPRKDIPVVMLAAIGIQFVFGTINPIIAALTPPGIEAVSQLPWPMIPGRNTFNVCFLFSFDVLLIS